VRDEVLVQDPLIPAVLQDELPALAPRTVRHRFLQATGLTQTQIRQIERAQLAAARLQAGVSILDTVDEFDYFDQPHLTRSLKRWVGQTPAQLFRAEQAE
jgi:AraC-like DNA-binding protein